MKNETIIGMDISQSKDYTKISTVCSNCKQIIKSKEYDPEIHGVAFKVFETCPHCGIKLVNGTCDYDYGMASGFGDSCDGGCFCGSYELSG
jgi:transcription initiation factor TFIIIB Brf1 subunit/transcription initiation factor TFIIB